MADETGPVPTAPNGDAGVPNGDAPQASIRAQYVKDLSFENPNSPAIYQNAQPPQIDVKFDIAHTQAGEGGWEVLLRIEVSAKSQDTTAFQVELSYAGLFELRNIPEEQMQPFLLIDAPAMLFPFARRILADSVRDGGFPPLMLDPIDFGGLYMQQQAQLAQGGGGEVPIPPAGDA